MADEIVEPWHGKVDAAGTYLSSPPPPHTHSLSDVGALTSWQASIEYSLAAQANDIDVLKKCVVALVFIVCTLAILLLVFLG